MSPKRIILSLKWTDDGTLYYYSIERYILLQYIFFRLKIFFHRYKIYTPYVQKNYYHTVYI